MKIPDVVKEEAIKAGWHKQVDDDMIEYIVWNHTGYPSFWPDPDISVEDNFRMQVAEFFQETIKNNAKSK